MPQLPFLVDQLQIEPGSGDTILINRGNTGSLTFTDTQVPSGIRLADLLSLQNYQDVFVVGKINAPYATIQEAINAIPDGYLNNSVVLVTNGVYVENLTISKDNVQIIGMGATLVNDGDSSTVTIQVSETSTPLKCTIQDMIIQCDQDGKACVSVLGANQFASGTATIADFLLAGDTLSINGVTLVGVEGTRTSGLNNFSINAVSTDTLAIEITEALNDPNNNFSSFVNASVVGSIITINSNLPGSIGNTYTLVTTTADIILSSPTLTGGSSSGSSVGLMTITIKDSTLRPNGVGTYSVYADTVNAVHLNNVASVGSLSANVLVSNLASFVVQNSTLNGVNLNYNDTLDQPVVTTCEYKLSNVECSSVSINTIGLGTTTIERCNIGDLTVGGDQHTVLENTVRGNGFHSGTATVSEDTYATQLTFTGVSTVVDTFVFPQLDTDYVVLIESPSVVDQFGVTSKTVNNFTIDCSTLYTGTLNCIIKRV